MVLRKAKKEGDWVEAGGRNREAKCRKLKEERKW
jgi:hypothetical protein